ncbi:hypothetical protein M1589_04950 [Candidatus Marsarchaeota archaeon]|nr:hypothetical protein [Candidatus Marsarchaeota archaeon]MCL5115459.1 hypothetical protein [Candidatus Marsarchaeota archaeon]
MSGGTRLVNRATDADIASTRAKYQHAVPALLRLDAKLATLSADETSVLNYIDRARMDFGQRVLSVAVQLELGMTRERVEKALESLVKARLVSGMAYTVEEGLPDAACYEMTELGMLHVEVAVIKAEMQKLRPNDTVTDEDAIVFLGGVRGAARRIADMLSEGNSITDQGTAGRREPQ